MATANQMVDDTTEMDTSQRVWVFIESVVLILAGLALLQGYNLFAIAMILISIRIGLSG